MGNLQPKSQGRTTREAAARRRWRTFCLTLLLLSALGSVWSGLFTAAAAPAKQTEDNAAADPVRAKLVIVLTFEGVVTPVLHNYIRDGLQAAVARNAEAVILRLDTPGGSIELTKQINQTLLAAPVPVVVYVSPIGAHAGSAGTFITLAAHAAAMTPGSSIGAASPVGGGGEEIGETMEAKVKNLLSADIENLASRRGEAATEWAIRAVQEAAAATADQAVTMGVIDLIATDLPDLLAQLDGLSVEVQGQPRTLQTADVLVETLELNLVQQFLNFISNPTIASLLLTLGTIGLITELRAPGTWIPGIVGAISLLLALYALGQLQANFAGLALVVLAIGLLAAELFTPTFGILALGGVLAFVLGSALLFDAPGIEVPWTTIITVSVLMGGFVLFVAGKVMKAMRSQPYTGSEGLINRTAIVKQAFTAGELGSIFVVGEWWNAELEEGHVEPGETVTVVGRTGYRLLVRRTNPHPNPR